MAQQSDKEVLKSYGYKIISRIGKGSFSTVYRATNDQPNKAGEYAIKVLKPKERSRQEAEVLKMLNHENIVKYVEHFSTSTHVFLITEFCDEGDLEDYIHKKHKLAESLVKIIIQQLAMALHYLQSFDICHMDIKPKNILICSKPRFTFKLSDFGVAEVITEENMDKWRENGTIGYMAPEKAVGKPYDIRSDIWSLGIVMFQCLFGRPSYFQSNVATVKTLMTKENLIKIPSNACISSACEDLLTKMLKYNPENRIQFHDFYNHPFLDLGNIPNYQNIIKTANEAVKLDQEKKYEESIVKYQEAIDLLNPYLEMETDEIKKSRMQDKGMEYAQRISEICNLLNDRNIQNKTLPPDGTLDMLCKLATSTPKLVTGVDIGKVAEAYLVEGNYKLAFLKLNEALEVLIPLCSSEPQGHRKKLLLAQIEKWLKMGEELKKRLPEQTE